MAAHIRLPPLQAVSPLTFMHATRNMDNFLLNSRRTVRTLDFADFLHGDANKQSKFCRELIACLSTVGFVKLVNHGLSDEELYEVFEWVHGIQSRTDTWNMLTGPSYAYSRTRDSSHSPSPRRRKRRTHMDRTHIAVTATSGRRSCPRSRTTKRALEMLSRSMTSRYSFQTASSPVPLLLD